MHEILHIVTNEHGERDALLTFLTCDWRVCLTYLRFYLSRLEFPHA